MISKDGTIGRVAIVPPELEGANITQHLVRASIHPSMNREFVAHAIRAPQSQAWLVGETKGVALQGVNVEDFRRLAGGCIDPGIRTSQVDVIQGVKQFPAKCQSGLLVQRAAEIKALVER